MGKKLRIAIAILFVALLGAVIWQAQRQQEPVYQGKPLSFWLEGYDLGNYNHTHPKGPAPPTYDEANEAIRQIGTNAVPALLRMLQQPDSKFKLMIMGLLQKQHFVNILWAPANRNFKAYRGFVALGAGASNAVTRLLEIFDRDHSAFSQSAVPTILGDIGPASAQAIPALLRGMTHTNCFVRGDCIFALRHIHASSKMVMPALIKCLNDTNAQVRAQAVRSLGAFGKDAQSAVPALIELLRKEPPRPTSGPMLSVEGGMVCYSWITPAFPMVNFDVVGLTRAALQSIDTEAAAKAGVK